MGRGGTGLSSCASAWSGAAVTSKKDTASLPSISLSHNAPPARAPMRLTGTTAELGRSSGQTANVEAAASRKGWRVLMLDWSLPRLPVRGWRRLNAQESDKARRRSHAQSEALLAFRRRSAAPMCSIHGRFSSDACIRAKSRRIRCWQMKDANPLAVEAVCGRPYPPQPIVILNLVIIIRV
jgi:hypothetical protein